jgi:hypothetical protein
VALRRDNINEGGASVPGGRGSDRAGTPEIHIMKSTEIFVKFFLRKDLKHWFNYVKWAIRSQPLSRSDRDLLQLF